MGAPLSDALVLFGAIGDLAYKKIFPSRQGLIRDEGFNLPIIGVSDPGPSINSRSAPKPAWSIMATWIRRPSKS